MISIGADFGGPTVGESPIGLTIRSAMNAAASVRGDWVEGSAPGVNVVFHVPGLVEQYGNLTKIEASRFSRKQKLLLVAVPVPKHVADVGGSIDFVIDALHKANAIAANVFEKKTSERFDTEKAEAIVERIKAELVARPASISHCGVSTVRGEVHTFEFPDLNCHWRNFMVGRLPREELVELVNDIMNPKGFTSEEINQKLDLFAINCPDPAAAVDVVVETLGPVTAEGLVSKALAYPPRDPKSLPESELHPEHPLRLMRWMWREG